MNTRGGIDVEDLLKLVLVLVVVWLLVEILGGVFGLLRGVFGLLPDLLGVIILVLIVLWLLDRI